MPALQLQVVAEVESDRAWPGGGRALAGVMRLFCVLSRLLSLRGVCGVLPPLTFLTLSSKGPRGVLKASTRGGSPPLRAQEMTALSDGVIWIADVQDSEDQIQSGRCS